MGLASGFGLIYNFTQMDDIVKAAMAKWPNVPDVYGWLELDRRGNWLIRGERISNAALNAFIGRNYTSDEQGRWFFQNGPQRVFVTLHATPFIYSLQRNDDVVSAIAHTGVAVRVDSIMLDGSGAIVLATDLGPGLVQDRDLGILLDAAQSASGATASEEDFAAFQRGENRELRIDFGSATFTLERVSMGKLPARFHFDPSPVSAAVPAAREP